MTSRPLLIVGSSGQLARALVEQAAAKGFAATAVGRPVLDLASAETISAAIRSMAPALIINAAAATAVDLAESEPDAAFAVNRDGAAALAKAARLAGLPFIHVSTDYVFDGAGGAPYTEASPTNPLGVYGQSKLEGEQAVREAHPEAVTCRTSWVYSPWPKNFALTMLNAAAVREEVSVVDDQFGAPTYAPHLAEALLTLGVKLCDGTQPAIPPLLHLTNSGETSWHGFAAAIFEKMAKAGRKVPKLNAIPTSGYPTPARRPGDTRLDCSLAEQHLGYRIQDWRAGLDDWAERTLAA